MIIFFDETPRDYISLTFRTNSSIGETTILIDIFGGYYEINEGKYLDFNKFYSGVPYYLTFKAKSGNLLNLQLTFSKIEELGIDNFSLIEYKDINHTIILNSTDYPIEKKSSEISTSVDLSYVIKNYETNLIIVKLYPKNCIISKFHALITVENFYFYLNLNQAINLEKLIKDSYYFSLEVTQNLLINISLNMNYNKTDFPFENLVINEVESAFSTNNLEFHPVRINSPSQNIIYKIINNRTKFLTLKFMPQFKFEQIKLTYNYAKELITTYNLIKGEAKDLIDIQPKIPYYFDIKASFLKTLNISFEIDYSPLEPFHQLKIYENFNKENNNFTKVGSYVVPFIRNEAQLKVNLFYTVYDSSTSNVTLYTEPNNFIKSMSIKFDIGGESYQLKNGTFFKYTNLFKNFRYFFIIDTNQTKNASFNINVKSSSSNSPLAQLKIYEMLNKIIKYEISEPYSEQNKDDEVQFGIFHEINFTSTDELMLEIEPKYNLDYINISINLDSSEKGYVPKKDEKGNNPRTEEKGNSTLIIALSIVGGVVVIACIIFVIIVIKKQFPDSNLIDTSPPKDGNDKSLKLLPNLE